MKKLDIITTMHSILILAVLLSTTQVYSYTIQSGNLAHDTQIKIGGLTEFAKRIQTDDSGGTTSFDPRLFIGANFRLDLVNDFIIFPGLAFSLPDHDADEDIRRLNYFLRTSVGYQFDRYIPYLGLGLYFTRISSDGGTQSVNNGLGTDDFFLPSTSVTAMNLVTITGLDVMIDNEWSAGFEGLLFNLTDSKRRSFSYIFSVNYHLTLGFLDD